MTSADLSTRLTAMRVSTSAMIADFDGQRWTDADMAAPTALPNWTRGHVLTHIARNADSIARALSGALRGEIVKRYPNGPEGRAADIEAGAGRPVLEQLADVRESAERLDRVFAAVADADAWEATADSRPSRRWIRARWQEVEVHRIDADSGYTVDQWPADFVALLLPRLADRLPGRARGPLRLEVTADGSLNPDLVGREWVVTGWAPGEAPNQQLGRDPGEKPVQDRGAVPDNDVGQHPGGDRGGDPRRATGGGPGQARGADLGGDRGEMPGKDAGQVAGAHRGHGPAEEPVDVRGPDWAILAWLTGRTSTIGDALSALPELDPWM